MSKPALSAHLEEPERSATQTKRAFRIGIDVTSWGLRRGFGRYTRELISALAEIDNHNKYVLFVDRESAAELSSRHEIRVISNARSARNGARRLAGIVCASWIISREPLDVMLFPAIYSFIPLLSRAKVMIVFHDATAEMLPDLALHDRAARILWNTKVAIGKWQADRLIAVSDYARSQLTEHLNVPAERITLVGEAPASIFRAISGSHINHEGLAALGVNPERRVIVHLGGFSPHKNLFYLLREFRKLIENPAYADVDLMLVGNSDPDAFHTCYTELVDRVRKFELTDRVRFVGFVPDDLLVHLLNVAVVTVMPSLNEGFGLPAVEAAACGCPVIATLASPLPTILGAGAVYIDPRQHGALREALERILCSPELRCKMSEAGQAATAKLSWKTEAAKLLDAIEALANQ